MNLPLAAGSLAAVLALAGIAWALKLGGTRCIADAQQAARLAEDAIAGFDAEDAVVCNDGQGAVVIGRDGSFALIRPSGARFIVRQVRRPHWQATAAGIEIDGGDPVPIRLALECALVDRLSARLDEAADNSVSSVRV